MTPSNGPTTEGAGAARPRFGRRQYIVDRRFQLKYSLLLAAGGGLVTVAFGAIAVFLQLDAALAVERTFDVFGARVPGELKAQLSAHATTLVWVTGATAALLALGLALFGVLLTHRVAGPIHVMGRYIASLAEGRYPRMRPLRKNDELKPFFDRFTHAIEAMRLRDVEEAEGLEHVAALLEPVAQSEEQKRAIQALREVSARRREATTQAPPGRLGVG